MAQREKRFLALEDLGDNGLVLEERAGERPKLRGYAARFNSPSSDLGGFKEILLPSAFDAVLGKKYKRFDVVGLFDHVGQPIGRESNGTLSLSTDERGLKFEMTPPDTQLGRDVQTLVRDGYVSGCSFAFTVDDSGQSWKADEKGNMLRTISSVTGLYDVSIVTTPAYPATSVALRSLDRVRQAWQQLEQRAAADLTISIDFDDTFTAAPDMWRSFILDAQDRGASVVCISRREDTTKNQEEVRAAFGELYDRLDAVILCGVDAQKRSAAEAAGLAVDIWIDDSPETIPARQEVAVDQGLLQRAAAARLRLRSHAAG